MKKYCNQSLKKYLDDLGARLPAPGGGSAAALSAATGAALLSMVLNFTIGKPKYAKFDLELKGFLRKSERLRLEFLRLVDLDVTAYKGKNLRDCLNVPFMVARLSLEAAKLCPPLVKKGNRNLVTDVACAAVMLEGAFASAVHNVSINLKLINDKKLTSAVRRELDIKGRVIRKIRLDTEGRVREIIESR